MLFTTSGVEPRPVHPRAEPNLMKAKRKPGSAILCILFSCAPGFVVMKANTIRTILMHVLFALWVSLFALLWVGCAGPVRPSPIHADDLEAVDPASIHRASIDQASTGKGNLSPSLRLFRLAPGVAGAHSHDLDFLRSLLDQRQNRPLSPSIPLVPEELEGLQRFLPCADCGEPMPGTFAPGPLESNVLFKFKGSNRTFSLTQQNAGSYIDEERPVTLEEKGRIIFTETVCQSTFDLPLLYTRLIDGRLAFEYLEGPCGPHTRWNSFFDGSNINRTFHADSSRQVFVFWEKIGFITRRAGKDLLLFNGHIISPPFDCIRGYLPEDPAPPLLEIYSDGRLLFGARDGKNIYLGIINLADFLGKGKDDFRFVTGDK